MSTQNTPEKGGDQLAEDLKTAEEILKEEAIRISGFAVRDRDEEKQKIEVAITSAKTQLFMDIACKIQREIDGFLHVRGGGAMSPSKVKRIKILEEEPYRWQESGQ